MSAAITKRTLTSVYYCTSSTPDSVFVIKLIVSLDPETIGFFVCFYFFPFASYLRNVLSHRCATSARVRNVSEVVCCCVYSIKHRILRRPRATVTLTVEEISFFPPSTNQKITSPARKGILRTVGDPSRGHHDNVVVTRVRRQPLRNRLRIYRNSLRGVVGHIFRAEYRSGSARSADSSTFSGD